VKLRWTPGAVEHLRSAYPYLERENPKAAGEMVDRIVSALEQLEQFPMMGRAGRVEHTRELVVTGTPFLVAYRCKADYVHILAVLHGARTWPKKF
jgi:toxin ParE1/3/4